MFPRAVYAKQTICASFCLGIQVSLMFKYNPYCRKCVCKSTVLPEFTDLLMFRLSNMRFDYTIPVALTYRCPYCDFRALMDPQDKVFACMNTKCEKVSTKAVQTM